MTSLSDKYAREICNAFREAGLPAKFDAQLSAIIQAAINESSLPWRTYIESIGGVESLAENVGHGDNCLAVIWPNISVSPECSCGLSALRSSLHQQGEGFYGPDYGQPNPDHAWHDED